MANRDVQLIIRAKDQASKTLDQISKANEAFTKSQRELSKSSDSTNASVGELGLKFAELNSQLEGAKALDKLSGNLGKAEISLDNVRRAVAGSTDDLAKYTQENAKAAAELAELEARGARLATELKQQKADLAATAKSTISVAAATTELARAEAAYQKVLARQADGKKVDTKAAADRLANAQATKAAADAAAASAANQRKAIDETNKTITSNNAALREATKLHKSLETAVESETSALAQNSDELRQAESAYNDLRTTVSQAAKSFGVVADEQGRLASVTPKVAAEAERFAKVLQAIGRYSKGDGQFVDPTTATQFQKQRQEIEKTEASLRELEGEMRRVTVASLGSDGATKSQTQTLIQLRSAAEAARSTLAEQRAELDRMSGATEKIDALAAALNRYQTGTGQIASAPVAEQMRKQSTAVEEARQRWEKLREETARLNAAMKSGAGATSAQAQRLREVSSAADQAEREFKETTAALMRMNAANMSGGMRNGIEMQRTALSMTQRLRGEVLSLTASYIGLYGVISNVQGVISAYQKMEAAQNRLGVVFGQNQGAIRNEMQWLQMQSQRLGIEFGSLADQYTKFAVSAEAANFSAAATRDVFLSVAEAGRVNKLSLDDMNGVFLALQQMISKGRIGSEELRQQLGERLPGAMNIMADALGMTTAELSKMMEEGEVVASQGNMLKFANELTKRFGSQLPKALQSTTTQIGRFWDNVFQAQMQFANGGFLDAFNRMLEELNKWFQSRDGRDFFLSLGAAAGKLVDGLSFLFKHIDSIGNALKAIVAIKVGFWATGIVTSMIAMGQAIGGVMTGATQVEGRFAKLAATSAMYQANMTRAATATATFGNALFGAQIQAVTMGTKMVFANTAVGTFTARMLTSTAAIKVFQVASAAAGVAIRGLSVVLAALGGPIGILVQIASFFAAGYIAKWATGVDSATSALDEHQRIMQGVLAQYDELKGKAGEWAEIVEGVSLDQAEGNLKELVGQFEVLRKSLAFQAKNTTTVDFSYLGALDADARKFNALIQDLGNKLSRNEIKVGEFREELEKLYASTDNDAVKDYIRGLLEGARKTEDMADKVSVAAEIAQGFGSKMDELADYLGISTERLEDTAEAATDTTESMTKGAEAAAQYGEAINKMKEFIPSLNEEMERLKKTTELNAAAWTALIAAWESGDYGKIMEVMKLWGQGFSNITMPVMGQEFIDKKLSGSLVDRIIGVESGGDANAKNPNSSATGLGQFIESTWLRMFKEYFPDAAGGMTNEAILALRNDADTSRKMVELYVQENAKFLANAGIAIDDANLYLAHFLGPGGAKALLGSAPGTKANDVLGSDQINANAGILDGKTREQVIAWAQRKVGITKTELDIVEGIQSSREEEAKKAEEERQKAQEATDKALADMGFEKEMLDLRLAGKEKEAFIEEELRRLREANPNVTDEELARAKELLTLKYQQNAALDAQKEKGTEIEQIEQRINDLETQRNALLEQRKIYEEQGDNAKMKEVDAELVGINAKLTEAITKAQGMHAAIGGEGADASIAKLKTMGLEIENANLQGQKFKYTAAQVQESIASSLSGGIVNMFDAFAKAVANGEDAVGALGDAFRQFAADFLMMIAKMIIEQTIFNMVQGLAKSLTGGLGGIMGFHTGGVVGAAGNPMIQARPGWFNNATRYHKGGIAGLKPGEMPAILKVGEEVLTDDDPRHVRNGGGAPAGGGNTKILNMFDAPSFLSEALGTAVGEKAILNFVTANSAAFKQAMG